MKVKIKWRSERRSRAKTLLVWIERLLITGACAILGYTAWVMIDTATYQAQEARQFEQLVPKLAPPPAPPGVEPLHAPSPPAELREGAPVSKLEIPSAGISVVVVEGISAKSLRRAVGHVPGTALPGQNGNIGIAGHRDTFFRGLRNVKPEDRILLTTAEGTYDYSVEYVTVVGPRDVQVLAASEEPVLTLVTCYPFYYVGAAPQRYIVRARLEQPFTALAVGK
jgi:sortase A